VTKQEPIKNQFLLKKGLAFKKKSFRNESRPILIKTFV